MEPEFSGFPIENGLKQGDDLSPLLLNFALEYTIKKVQETRLGVDQWYPTGIGLCGWRKFNRREISEQ